MAIEAFSLVATTSGAAGAKGSWNELTAATSWDASELHFAFNWSSNALRQYLYDIGIGSAGAETILIADIPGEYKNAAVVGSYMKFDVDIPSGSRLAIRSQSANAAEVSNTSIHIVEGALRSLSAPVTYGTDSANSKGTVVDPGAVASTKGSYVELTSSTTADITDLVVCVTSNTPGEAIGAFTWYRLDIATGGAGAETVVIPDISTAAHTATDSPVPKAFRFPVSIPSGTRISARAESSSTTAGDRYLVVTIIGMDLPAAGGGGGGGASAYTFIG